MLRLIVPECVHREMDDNGKWHLMWGDTPGPFMVCGIHIRHRETVSIDTLEDDAEVCNLCLGAMVISLDNPQKISYNKIKRKETKMETFYEDMQNVREGINVEESLERLVKSTLLDRQAIFYWDRWIVLCDNAKANGSDIDFTGKDAWYELLRPALFLAIHNITDTKWESLMEEQLFNIHESRLFLYLRSAIRTEIETFIFNGASLSQHTRRVCDLPEYILENIEAPQNTEAQAEAKLLLGQIRDELNDDEWLIITTTDYGEGREVAAKLEITEEALRKRRQRIRERLRGKFRY